ncbi:MAG: potassium channel protein [Deltaproteobacteria bacterium]|nr:potassium channel protein [Deltaproteobacteria bacterium]
MKTKIRGDQATHVRKKSSKIFHAKDHFKVKNSLYHRFGKRLLLAFGLYLFALVAATSSLILVEGWNFSDSLYMAVLTLTTVGYGEVNPLTPTGRYLMIVIMLFDNVVFVFAVGMMGSTILEGDLMNVFRGEKLMKLLDKLENHIIIVGLGRVGRQAAEVLSNYGQQVVAIEKAIADEEITEQEGWIVIKGDGREENVLRATGIERAGTLCACLPAEGDNLVLTIMAKEYNPGITVIARAHSKSFAQRLRRAGADNVILPEAVAGTRVALEILGGGMEKLDRFLELRATSKILLEEVKLTSRSPLVGRTLGDSRIREDWHIVVFLISAEDGQYEATIPIGRVFKVGDELWVFGRQEDLNRFIKEVT